MDSICDNEDQTGGEQTTNKGKDRSKDNHANQKTKSKKYDYEFLSWASSI